MKHRPVATKLGFMNHDDNYKKTSRIRLRGKSTLSPTVPEFEPEPEPEPEPELEPEPEPEPELDPKSEPEPTPEPESDNTMFVYADVKAKTSLYEIGNVSPEVCTPQGVENVLPIGSVGMFFYPMVADESKNVFMRTRTVDASSGEMNDYWACIQTTTGHPTLENFRIVV